MTNHEDIIVIKMPNWAKEGKALRAARVKAKISQTELAQRMGVSATLIRKIETGKKVQRRQPIVTCYRLALKDIISNRLNTLE